MQTPEILIVFGYKMLGNPCSIEEVIKARQLLRGLKDHTQTPLAHLH